MKKIALFMLLAFLLAGCSGDEDDPWDVPTIPMSLVGIETVNIDNSEEFPVLSTATVKKEAYMLGVKWLMDNIPSDTDDKFITGPIPWSSYAYSSVAEDYSKAIKCNTPFNANIPAGKYVSKFFKEVNRTYLPKGINEGFVLLVAPDAGEHSFRVEYYKGEELVFFHDTPLIKFD